MENGRCRLVAKENPDISVELPVDEIWDKYKVGLYAPWMEEEALPE